MLDVALKTDECELAALININVEVLLIKLCYFTLTKVQEFATIDATAADDTSL